MNYLDNGYTRNSWRDSYKEYCAEKDSYQRGAYDWETEDSVYFFTAPELSYKQRLWRAMSER